MIEDDVRTSISTKVIVRWQIPFLVVLICYNGDRPPQSSKRKPLKFLIEIGRKWQLSSYITHDH